MQSNRSLSRLWHDQVSCQSADNRSVLLCPPSTNDSCAFGQVCCIDQVGHYSCCEDEHWMFILSPILTVLLFLVLANVHYYLKMRREYKQSMLGDTMGSSMTASKTNLGSATDASLPAGMSSATSLVKLGHLNQIAIRTAPPSPPVLPKSY